MRLPLIKHIVDFVEENDQDWVIETIDLLEHIAESENIKEEELEVIGELISNMYGSLEVHRDMKNGKEKKEALNAFMKRVMSSIN